MRILFRNYNVSDYTKQQLLYGAAVLICVVSVFGIIIFLSFFSDDPAAGGFPSPTPGILSSLNQPPQRGQVAGAQQQMEAQQMEQLRQQQTGPVVPSLKPSPSTSPSPSPSPSPSQSPSPSPSPSAVSSPAASSAPSQPAPSAPTGLAATSGCNNNNVKVVLTWSSTSGASSYKVYRDGNQVGGDIETTSYTDTSVTAGTLYAYSVKAKNSGGESGHSDSKTITPQPCPLSSSSASPNP